MRPFYHLIKARRERPRQGSTVRTMCGKDVRLPCFPSPISVHHEPDRIHDQCLAKFREEQPRRVLAFPDATETAVTASPAVQRATTR